SQQSIRFAAFIAALLVAVALFAVINAQASAVSVAGGASASATRAAANSARLLDLNARFYPAEASTATSSAAANVDTLRLQREVQERDEAAFTGALAAEQARRTSLKTV